MRWSVETLNAAVDDEISAPPKDIVAGFLRLAERIEAVGLEQIGLPHLRHLKGKLWEMRINGRDGIARAIYITVISRRVIVLHAFMKKSQRTPKVSLALAEQRAKEITR